jgi:hypothetical protein
MLEVKKRSVWGNLGPTTPFDFEDTPSMTGRPFLSAKPGTKPATNGTLRDI